MSLEHLLLSRYPSVEPTNPESINHLFAQLGVFGEVPRGEKMLYSGTDPESYITEYTLVYEDDRLRIGWTESEWYSTEYT